MKAPTAPQKMHNILILDESGSMESIRPSIISSFNEVIQTILAAHHKGISEERPQAHFVSLYIFNASAIREVHFQAPVSEVKQLTMDTYRPNSGTPLFDTMGIALAKHDASLQGQTDNINLVTILTDGEENASKEYDSTAIISLVNRLRAKGWVFTYIGTDHDVEKFSASISVNASLRFHKSPEGLKKMMILETNSRQRFYENAKNAHVNLQKENEDFFKE